MKARVPERANRETLRNFLSGVASPDERPYIYRDEASVFDGLVDIEREAVQHSEGEYVRGQAHTNGIEAFWSMLKWGIMERITRCR